MGPEKSKLAIRVDEYVVTTPLETEMRIVVMVISHSWVSSKASPICLMFSFVLHTPVWFELTCWRRATFSCSESHFALIGVSGIKKKVNLPTIDVTRPRTRNIIRHPSRSAFLTCWKPKEMMPPIICAAPSPMYQKVNRGACSLRV